MTGSPDLLALYQSLDYPAIRRMVDDKAEEGIHTEYKRWSKDHYRGHLVQALSGFANADGGIIVWGIGTVKGPNGADQADAELPVPDPDSVRVNLQAVEVNATEPRVRGVEHRVVMHPNSGGFILTFIPASESGPHMAKLGHDRFYRRDAIGHHRMGQAEVGDMFGRRPRPSLDLHLLGINGAVKRAAFPMHTRDKAWADIECDVHLGLVNDGRGLARFPSIKLDITPRGRYLLDGSKQPTEMPRIMSPVGAPSITFAGGGDDVVHSGTEIPFAVITTTISLQDVGKGPRPDQDLPDLSVEYTITAAGVQPKTGRLIVQATEIIAAALETPHSSSQSIQQWFDKAHSQRMR